MTDFLAAHPTFFTWVLLPALIFAARSFDVSLSTLRIVFIAQGRRVLAPLVGFVESLIWLVVIGQAIKHLSNPLCVVAWAAGFAAGNSIGLYLEQRLAMGMRLVRVIVRENADLLVAALRGQDLGVTLVHGEGTKGPVQILFTLVRRRDLARALDLIRNHNPAAFVTIEDVRQAAEGVFPALEPLPWSRMPWRSLRKTS